MFYTTNIPCSGTTNLTASSGSFTDGSAANDYGCTADCKWLIQPTGATSITLNFTSFNTESGYDFVKVYNGPTTASPLLGSFSGTSLPPTLNSTSGSMLVHFTSDGDSQYSGWSATYNAIGNAPVASFTASNTNICKNDCISFTDNSTNTPTSWSWSFPGGNPSSSTLQNPTNICYNTIGQYNVSLTATNSVGGNTATMTNYVTVNECTGITNLENFSDIYIFPNPSDGGFTLTVKNQITDTYSISIYNLFGEKVWEQINIKPSITTFNINLQKYSEGIHFIHVSSINNTTFEKIIFAK